MESFLSGPMTWQILAHSCIRLKHFVWTVLKSLKGEPAGKRKHLLIPPVAMINQKHQHEQPHWKSPHLWIGVFSPGTALNNCMWINCYLCVVRCLNHRMIKQELHRSSKQLKEVVWHLLAYLSCVFTQGTLEQKSQHEWVQHWNI